MDTTTEDYRAAIAYALMAQPKEWRRAILQTVAVAHAEEARVAAANAPRTKKAARALADDCALAIGFCMHGARDWGRYANENPAKAREAREHAATFARKAARNFARWSEAQAVLGAANTARYWRKAA